MQAQANYSCILLSIFDDRLLFCCVMQFSPMIRPDFLFRLLYWACALQRRESHNSNTQQHSTLMKTLLTCNQIRNGRNTATRSGDVHPAQQQNIRPFKWSKNTIIWLRICGTNNLKLKSDENDANYQIDKRLLLVFSIKLQTLHWFRFNWCDVVGLVRKKVAEI